MTSFRRRVPEMARCTDSTEEGPALQTMLMISFSSSVSEGRTGVIRSVTVQDVPLTTGHVNEKNDAVQAERFSGGLAGCCRSLKFVTATELTLDQVTNHRQTGTKSGFAMLAFGVVTAGTVNFRRFWSFDSHST